MVRADPVVQLGIVVLSVVGLWVGARLLVDAVVRLAQRVGLSDLTIGLTVVAAGTSMPELVVSLDAAWKGLGNIAVANVVGSNVYNLAFVLGVVSLVRMIPITESLVRRDGVALLARAVGGAVDVRGVEEVDPALPRHVEQSVRRFLVGLDDPTGLAPEPPRAEAESGDPRARRPESYVLHTRPVAGRR
jgi:hypothetical protein